MADARNIAHAILETTEQVYETTGWCKNVLINRDGERCLNGALVVGIVTHCTEWLRWGSPLNTMYPHFYVEANNSDVETAAVLLATANLAKAARQVAEEIGVPIRDYQFEGRLNTLIMRDEAVLTDLNDNPATTREDILLAIGKARADT